MSDQIISKLVWIDLEATGLDLKKDKIIQIAVLITDLELNILDENGYIGFVGIGDEDVTLMDDVVKEMHTSNGLIEICKKSDLTVDDIDQQAVEYISRFVGKKESPLCGNSIAYDRALIEYNMPVLKDFLHYRNIDVSTLKQLARIWGKGEHGEKDSRHEAMGDVRASIEEMKWYREALFG